MIALAHNDEMSLIELLLDYKADVNISDKFLTTPLMQAIKYNRNNAVTLFLNKGSDINAVNKLAQTPLIVAIQNNNTGLTKMLLERGANPNHGIGQSPLIIAIQNSNTELIKMLLERGVNPNHGSDNIFPIIQAIKTRNIKILDLLLNYGVDVNIQNDLGHTPLMIAYLIGSLDMFHTLLIGNADPNIKNNKGDNLLKMIVYSEGRIHHIPSYLINSIELLIEFGANPVLEGEWGKIEVTLSCASALQESTF